MQEVVLLPVPWLPVASNIIAFSLPASSLLANLSPCIQSLCIQSPCIQSRSFDFHPVVLHTRPPVVLAWKAAELVTMHDGVNGQLTARAHAHVLLVLQHPVALLQCFLACTCLESRESRRSNSSVGRSSSICIQLVRIWSFGIQALSIQSSGIQSPCIQSPSIQYARILSPCVQSSCTHIALIQSASM